MQDKMNEALRRSPRSLIVRSVSTKNEKGYRGAAGQSAQRASRDGDDGKIAEKLPENRRAD